MNIRQEANPPGRTLRAESAFARKIHYPAAPFALRASRENNSSMELSGIPQLQRGNAIWAFVKPSLRSYLLPSDT